LTSMAPGRARAYLRGMESQAEIVTRWRYLRGLLIEQLTKFESGELKIHSGAEDVSEGAIGRLKREIEDFDGLIRVSERRDAQG
jgi:vacuolar-type H+-ATPase subunit E/Vma4